MIERINDWLIQRLIKDSDITETVKNYEHRKKIAFIEAWISIILNLLLALVKMFMGLAVNSISLLADAVHTASDIMTSAVVLVGFKLASIPPDEKHPHGHGRMELLAALIIAFLLILIGVKFGYDSYLRVKANTIVEGTYFVAVFMLAAGLVKEILSRMSFDLGQRIKSGALAADGWHHRTDAIASILVAIAILGSHFGYYWLDAVLGLGVSALIIWTGIDIFIDSASKLVGEVDQDDIDQVQKLALSVPGVKSIHDIIVHDYGWQKNISVHIEVDPDTDLVKAHDIADTVEETINEGMYAQSVVHVDTEK